MLIQNFQQFVQSFFTYLIDERLEIYNEFSLQHELGIFLREKFPDYKIQFERNISYFGILNKTIKHEIDIVIYSEDKSEKYAMELKFPRNGQVPEQMYSFAKDILFMEQLKDFGFKNTYVLTIVDNQQFYKGKSYGIYKFFRETHCVEGKIFKPTGDKKDSEFIEFKKSYCFDWKSLPNGDKYYCIDLDLFDNKKGK